MLKQLALTSLDAKAKTARFPTANSQHPVALQHPTTRIFYVLCLNSPYYSGGEFYFLILSFFTSLLKRFLYSSHGGFFSDSLLIYYNSIAISLDTFIDFK